MQENSLSLDEVKSHFEDWRITRSKQRERIPEYLWNEVKILIDHYSLQDITQALRINTSQIKDNLKIATKINFFEAQLETSSSLTSQQIAYVQLSFIGQTVVSLKITRFLLHHYLQSSLNLWGNAMLQITPQHRLLLAVEPIDFRKGICALKAQCQQKLLCDPFSGAIFADTCQYTANHRTVFGFVE